jgi:hypothetical protein
MDSILVVVYSYTGVSRKAAQLLCSHHGWPLGEIVDTRPRGTLRCALDSLLRRKPPVRYQGPYPGDFRTVVLVSPIWMYRLAGPMRSFLHDNAVILPRVAVISTMGGAGASIALAELTHILGRRPIANAAFTQQEIEDGSGTARLLAFGDGLWGTRASGTAAGAPAASVADASGPWQTHPGA